nr:hypothetical protein [Tanacetum cinerariifolium]
LLQPVVSPIAESPGYVVESDPKEDPEEYDDDEAEDGPAAISFQPKVEVKRLLAIPTPSPSPFTLLLPPFAGERLARCSALAALTSLPLPPPLYMPPPVDRRDDIPETEMPPYKRLCLSTLGSRYEVGEGSTARPTEGQEIDYGFASTLDAEPRRREIGEVGVTELAELHEHDTHDLYALLEDAQDRGLETIQIVKDEAYAAPGAGVCTQVLAPDTPNTTVAEHSHSDTAPVTWPCFQIQQTKIAKLRETDRQHEAQMAKTLRVMGDMRREMGDIQAKLLALRGQPRRAGQPGGDSIVPNRQDAPRDAHRTEGVVKFATCTLLDAAMTWWNSQIRSLGPDAYSMTWEVLKKKMTDKYCPQGEIKKLKIELWNLKVKENDVSAYTERFQELTLICTKFFTDEAEKIDKYVSEFPDNIYGSVKASKPKTLDEAIELANELMDQKLRTFVERQSNNKRKADESFRNNHGHQQQTLKRKNVARVYNIGTGEKKPYSGNLPKMFSEETDKIEKYVGGLPDMIYGSVVASKPKTMQEAIKIATELMDKKSEPTTTTTTLEQEAEHRLSLHRSIWWKEAIWGSKLLCAKCNYHHDGPCAPKCHNCNKIGHFARDCRVTANTNNANNQRGIELGQKPTCYECGVKGHYKRECPKLKNDNNQGNQGGRNNALARVYAVGRAEADPDANVVTGTFLLNNRYASILFDTGDDRIFVSTTFSTQINTTPSTLDHYYDVELADGRIIGLNTILRRCTLNLLNHPFNINLMPVELGCKNFLAQISAKKEEDKQKGKQLKDVPVFQNHPEVFPKDLSGLPPARPVEFQIDLIPGAALVARAPYRLAPSEIKELSEQLQEIFEKGFIRPSSSP